ncbi:MAG: radical SAM protein [Planctomycetes bacterium]|nr:radical SAM protein [Planctomycetota bacterium]
MSGKLDLLLINPGSRSQVYQSLGKKLAAVENPVWAGLMATFCRVKGLSVDLIDAEAEELTPDQVAERVQHLKPTLAAVVVYGHQPSASTQIMTASGNVCTAIKQVVPAQKVLLVGGHVAALPERTLHEEAADYVAGGEGLHTMVQLVAALKTSRPDLSKVPGLWYRDNGHVCNTADTPLVGNLDVEMPGVAWDLFPMTKYRAHNWHCLDGLKRQPYAALYTTLGCPYHCTFCCIQAPFKSGEKAGGVKESTNSYRYWSPDNVIGQIEHLVKNHGVRNIKIADEMFVLNRKHVLGICDRIIERGYDLNIWAYTRVDTIKDGMLDTLKKAGVNWLAFGIEAGADRVRDNVDKSFSQQEVFDVIRKVQEAGISVIGNYIFGLPEDDLETMNATLDLAIDLNCEFGNFYSAMAYPGSPLYTMAVQQGVPLPEQWTGYSQHSRDCQPLPTKYLPARDVLKFRDEAFIKYYTQPRYLDMVQKRFGQETVDHIKEMTSHSLERHLVSGKLNVPATTLPETKATPAAPLVQLGTIKKSA